MDAQDILGLERKSANIPHSLQKYQKKDTHQSNLAKVTTLVPSYPLIKRRKVSRRAVPWVWRFFQNSARKYPIRLSHWVRVDDPPIDYPFSKFNRQSNIVEYNPEQYDRCLQDDVWTKEETDYLFDLLRQFELRFVVVADRYVGNKTMEEMKERYYSIAQQILYDVGISYVSSERQVHQDVRVAGMRVS